MEQTLESQTIETLVDTLENPPFDVGIPLSLWRRVLRRYCLKVVHPDFDPYKKQDLSGASDHSKALYGKLCVTDDKEEIDRIMSTEDFQDEVYLQGAAVSEVRSEYGKRAVVSALVESVVCALVDNDPISIAVPFSWKYHLLVNGLMDYFIGKLSIKVELSYAEKLYLRE